MVPVFAHRFFEGTAQEGVGGDPAGHDDGGRVVELRGPKELAGEGLDDGGLVASGQVRQLLVELLLRPWPSACTGGSS